MRKALVVGINDYDNISSLNWCENDAMGMSQALERSKLFHSTFNYK